ncbi:MAG: hypothetical protein C7B44_14995 [Sulfobacillus thermosulfidooxidans]|uniref:hypothetical protein n=1 Tax=Sulfobacillus TaxID=28033 RepID=UPI000CD23836|nr:hypothetical protein [Sulfobacillus sp. hq2]POB10577.1 hypothetical protein CO251_06975 [Sulfobacillus sp. hq2]PSR32918.1 MAG: hypothetical protein C7B44_14995 [Sulfobacillus thermosulfidooxidans]
MSKVPARSAVKTAIQMIHRLKPGTSLQILNFKKDRSVSIVRHPNGHMDVIEQGFVQQVWSVDDDTASTVLKEAIPREFPRSHELRFTVKNAHEKAE